MKHEHNSPLKQHVTAGVFTLMSDKADYQHLAVGCSRHLHALSCCWPLGYGLWS